VCYFLTIASPLTLSEIRSMLPAGLSAQPVAPAEAAAARRLLPGAQTVAVLLAGACSCDFVHSRETDIRQDERHLRARYGALRLSRDEIIRRLERHRHRPAALAGGPWPTLLAGFVAEHARNAGATLYSLGFGDGPRPAPSDPGPVTRTASQVREHATGWLEEDRPVLVVQPNR
jgi:hypothetical protein